MREAEPQLVAGVTVYRPDAALLLPLLDRIAADGARVLVEIDGPTGDAIDAELAAMLAADTRLDIAQSVKNRGIGAALNALAARARISGADRILLLDQDSTPPPGLAAALAARMDALCGAGERPAAIGPRPVAPPEEAARYRAPRYASMPGRAAQPGAEPVCFIITSGTLLDLAAFERIGRFRADYVIDAIDTEWCFRAWSRGGSVWLAPDLAMPHRVGHATVRRGPIAFPRQSPARMAYYVRNQAHGLRLRHVPLRWKTRSLTYLPLQALLYSLEQQRPLASLRDLGRAAIDGLAGRLGPRPNEGL